MELGRAPLHLPATAAEPTPQESVVDTKHGRQPDKSPPIPAQGQYIILLPIQFLIPLISLSANLPLFRMLVTVCQR